MKLKQFFALTLLLCMTIKCGDNLSGGESDACKEAKSLTILCRFEAARLAGECEQRAPIQREARFSCSPERLGYQALCSAIEGNGCD